jgi:hypothetical protein
MGLPRKSGEKPRVSSCDVSVSFFSLAAISSVRRRFARRRSRPRSSARRRFAVGLGLQRGLQPQGQRLEKAVDVALQRPRAPRRELQGLGAVRAVEVVHVDPVLGHGLVLGALLHEAPHHRVPPRPLGAQHEEVEALAANAQAEAQRLGGAGLPHHVGEVFELVAGGEGQRRGVRHAVEAGVVQANGHSTGVSRNRPGRASP